MATHDRPYTTVSIPIETAEKIEKLLSKGGYTTMAEFVRDAVRRKIESMEAA